MPPKPFERREEMGTKKVVMSILAILLAVFLAESASAQFWGDGWWDPSESGWGLNIIHQYDTMFVCLYVYGTDGSPLWFSAALSEGTLNSYGYPTYTGELIATTGPWFGGAFNPEAVNRWPVGSMTFSPLTTYSAQLSYTFGGVTVSKQIERFTFRRILLSGNYYGIRGVRSNNCGFGPAIDLYGTISLTIRETASGEITVIIYPGGTTMSGVYQQFGAVHKAFTNDWLSESVSYLQVTDFIPTETSFSADSVIFGPDCRIVYSIAAVKGY